jgi:UDP-glucose 4-epimerase
MNRRHILVVGGAGYIGSTASTWLLERGYEVTVLDDLSTGFRPLLAPGARFVEARAGSPEAREWLKQGKVDAVMHFAAKALAGESVEKPREYFENNVEQTRALLDSMREAGVRNFIFSSTCAVFGAPGTDTISEDLPKKPVNPYGETKLEVERMLAERALSEGLKSVALRYFNAAGAEPGLRVGELHDPETHIIPRVFLDAAAGREVRIFGTDYPTEDGTCVRDYVHVWDLAAAHEAALLRVLGWGEAPEQVMKEGRFEAFNLGSEKGFSVREVIAACEKVLGHKVRVAEKPRRPGDPPRLVADSRLAKKELGFRPYYSTLEKIVDTAWSWHQKARRQK